VQVHLVFGEQRLFFVLPGTEGWLDAAEGSSATRLMAVLSFCLRRDDDHEVSGNCSLNPHQYFSG